MNRVRVVGGKIKEREIADATIRWCIKKLMPRVRTLDIAAKFTKCDAYGYCFSNSSREFDLELRKGMSLFDLISTVCHEMVHVKQYYRGELKDINGYQKWKSKKFRDDMDYLQQPWEKEAFRLEEQLAIECFKQLTVSL